MQMKTEYVMLRNRSSTVEPVLKAHPLSCKTDLNKWRPDRFNCVEAWCTWSSGRTLHFRPLGPGFETRCIQVWGTVHPSSHFSAAGQSLTTLAVKKRC